MNNKIIEGFSKLTKEEKINWLSKNYSDNSSSDEVKNIFQQYWNENHNIQKLHDEFSENTISNFYMPYGIAPNFLIDNSVYAIPMAIEESSVIAAASNSAKFWIDKGGFKTKILGIEKLGHVHFSFNTDSSKLKKWFKETLHDILMESVFSFTENMRNRGGGVLSINLIDKKEDLDNYFQIQATFNTKDSMGANFINSCLEKFATVLRQEIESSSLFSEQEKKSLQIIMCILSNYTPECIVRAEVSCKIDQLKDKNIINSKDFVWKFKQAIDIANAEIYRATTHNKGIMNGVDSVVIATGNDFRAVEACAHTYASKSGKYKSLTNCEIKNNIFHFWIDLPISLGVVGGLTKLHPLVKASLIILGNPSAEKLMSIVAVAGLAQNFAALKSLVTTGIQKGHMKMHLMNILNQLNATDSQKEKMITIFKDKTITYSEVVKELNNFK